MPYRLSPNKSEELSSVFVMVGGSFFAMIAGYVNLVLLETSRMTLSHMTGNVARLSEALFRGSEISTIHFLLILLSFTLGAMFTGLFLADQHFQPRRLYGFLMIVEGVILFLATLFYFQNVWITVYLTSMAMGLQNAMASSFKGLIIRTTHLTGLLTDLGFMMGAFLRRRKFVLWRPVFFFMLILSFFIGGWIGINFYHWFKIEALLFPSIALIVGGIADIIYITKKIMRTQKDVL